MKSALSSMLPGNSPYRIQRGGSVQIGVGGRMAAQLGQAYQGGEIPRPVMDDNIKY